MYSVLGVGVVEVVVMVAEAGGGHVLCKLRAGQRRLTETSVGAGLVQGQGVERSEHAQVGKYWHVVARMAVAQRRNVAHQGDMEVGTPSITASYIQPCGS